MTQPSLPPDEVTALARRYAIDINLGDDESPDWQRLLGVREFAPSVEPTHEDDSLYEDEGWVSMVRTALAWSAEIMLSHRVGSDGTWNAVQRHLRNSSQNFGSSAYVGVRYFDRDGAADDAWQGVALVTWAPEGGDHTNPDRVSVTLTGHGKPVAITNPAASS